MTHFGFAFGVITASVIGGAFVIDHHLKNSPDSTTRTTTTTTVAEAPASVPSTSDADSAVKIADASTAVQGSATQASTESPAPKAEPAKPAKSPVRAGTSRSAPAPSLPDTPMSTPSVPAPVVNDVPATTPTPAPEQQPEKSEPQ